MNILGIDIGGSAIKGTLVDPETGLLVSKRIRFETGNSCTPQRHGELADEIVRILDYSGPIGLGFPGPIKNGIPWMAVNLHPEWVNMDAAGMFTQATGCPCFMLNDADAAGLAEIKFGAGRDYKNKVVLMITLGTGIGSAVFVNGQLLPNSEFGHMKINDIDVESRTSDAVRRIKGLSWKKWAKRLQVFFDEVEKLISPDLIIIGGGVSKDAEKYLPLIHLKAKIVPAVMLNNAGIIGAAMYAYDRSSSKTSMND